MMVDGVFSKVTTRTVAVMRSSEKSIAILKGLHMPRGYPNPKPAAAVTTKKKPRKVAVKTPVRRGGARKG